MDARAVPRGDWAASRDRAGAVAAAWRRSAGWRLLGDRFDHDAAADLDIAQERALALMADPGWASQLIAPLAAGLAADPLFEPPLKVNRERGRIGAVLFDAPAARVTASVLSATALAARPAASIILPGHVSVIRYVRAGGARIRRWRAAGDSAREIIPLAPQDGDVALHDGRSEGHVLTEAVGDIVMLTAILRAGAAPTMREYRIADGGLMRIASTEDAGSRTAMLLTLLRVSGRADAPQVFAAATRDPAPHARWSAMREWLALDAAAALPRLGAMADADDDAEVRATARATVALVERRRAECRA